MKRPSEAVVRGAFRSLVRLAWPAKLRAGMTGWDFVESNDDGWSLSMQLTRAGKEVAKVDVQVIEATCYLLRIFIAEDLRGRGLGTKLYEGVERFAAEVGCRWVEMTPSGSTHTGELRSSWIVRRRGYRLFGVGLSPVARKPIGRKW